MARTAKRPRWRQGVLTIVPTDEDSRLAGVVELVAQTFRRAARHVSTERNLVLFTWDAVHSHLTVAFTDRARARPSPEVWTLHCEGWGDASDSHPIRDAIERVLAIGEEHVEELRHHGVYIAFTTADEDAGLEYF